MKLFRSILATGVALSTVAALAACGGGTTTTTTTATTAPAGGKMGEYGGKKKGGAMKVAVGKTVTVGAQNGSKQTGSATIVNKGSGILVTLQLNNEPAGASEPAHIHAGTCKKLNPAPWKPLSNVVKGVSTTTVPGVTVAQLGKGKYAINVHKSAKDLKTYVACGGI